MIFVMLPLSFAVFATGFGAGMMVADDYAMTAAVVLSEPWDGLLYALCLTLSWILPVLLVVVYFQKWEKPRWAAIACTLAALLLFGYMFAEYRDYTEAVQQHYDPQTVVSTMIAVDEAVLAELQSGMVYCDAVLDEDSDYMNESIRRNTDVLVNNNGSTVYCYDTAQGGDVLADWGVNALPALVLLQDGAVEEVLTEWDIVKYFQDTERFSYSW